MPKQGSEAARLRREFKAWQERVAATTKQWEDRIKAAEKKSKETK